MCPLFLRSLSRKRDARVRSGRTPWILHNRRACRSRLVPASEGRVLLDSFCDPIGSLFNVNSEIGWRSWRRARRSLREHQRASPLDEAGSPSVSLYHLPRGRHPPGLRLFFANYPVFRKLGDRPLPSNGERGHLACTKRPASVRPEGSTASASRTPLRPRGPEVVDRSRASSRAALWTRSELEAPDPIRRRLDEPDVAVGPGGDRRQARVDYRH